MKKKKLIDRFITVPSDFEWDELVSLLSHLGFRELKKGKTGGSRRRFVDATNRAILLHKPHPGNIVKKYAINQVIEKLNEFNLLNDE